LFDIICVLKGAFPMKLLLLAILVILVWNNTPANASTLAIANFSGGKTMILIGQDGKLYSKGTGDSGWVQFQAQLPESVKAKELVTDASTTDALFQKTPAAIYVLGSDGQMYRFTDGSDGFVLRKLDLPNGLKPLASVEN
jgi:hypothetical protein